MATAALIAVIKIAVPNVFMFILSWLSGGGLSVALPIQRQGRGNIFQSLAPPTKVQLKRHHNHDYSVLDPARRERYAHSGKRLFSQTPSDRTSRDALRQHVAEDLPIRNV
jgi:hypothetical protein